MRLPRKERHRILQPSTRSAAALNRSFSCVIGVCLKYFRSYVFTIVLQQLWPRVSQHHTPLPATIIDYSLNSLHRKRNSAGWPYGTVELNDNGGPNVQVTVTLSGGEGFVNTGAGAALT